jgi:glycosyltransferase involved in cell wall biosynthesis
MKILIISEIYKKSGAGNATKNIFNFLRENLSSANEVKLLVPFEKSKDNDIILYYNSFTYFYYLFIKLFNRLLAIFFSLNRFYFFNKFLNISLFKLKKLKKITKNFKPDIIIILWYEYILNYEEILELKNKFNSKIILIPFDMYNFTGGCRYSQSCENFKNSCKSCPAVRPLFLDLPHKNYIRNKELINIINPEIIFPSKYAEKFTETTKILDNNVVKHLINYPVIDYKKTESSFIKRLKNQTKNKKIVFFGAQDLREWRKGAHNMINVLSNFKARYSECYSEIIFVSVGKNSKNILKKFSKNFIFLNNLKFEELIELYRYSNLIIIPSLQEWSSLMMSEAIKLNKIVFSFNTGSSKDLIINNVNGYVFEPYDYNKFSDMINDYFINPDNFFINNKYRYLNKINTVISEKAILEKYTKILKI